MTKKLLATFLVLGSLASVGYFGVNGVSADDIQGKNVVVERIAQKFNLQQDDVEAVFQAVRDEKLAEMEKQREEKTKPG